jgi:hypothetical protein
MFDFIEAGRDAQAIYDVLLEYVPSERRFENGFMAFSWVM